MIRDKAPTLERQANKAAVGLNSPVHNRFPMVSGGQRVLGIKELALTHTAPTELTITDKQFEYLLAALANGSSVEAALDGGLIPAAAVEGYLRAVPARYQAWREALLAGIRRGWTVDIFESICDAVAAGDGLRAACAEHGRSEKQFLQITRRDPAVKAMYEESRIIAAELEADDLRGIADEKDDDMLDDGKGGFRGNTAAVARSKLRVDTRLRLMTSYNRDRFAEKIAVPPGQTNVTVNISHADRLESARARAKAARAEQALDGQFVELQVSDAEGKEDLSWLET